MAFINLESAYKHINIDLHMYTVYFFVVRFTSFFIQTKKDSSSKMAA